MLGIDDLIESKILAGVVVAAGAAILAPIVVPVVLGAVRPVVKSAIKAGIVLYERGTEATVELGEALEDLVAEARAELRAAAPSGEGEDASSPATAAKAPTSGSEPAPAAS